MFCWEFPPHISGGMGVASAGITKALSQSGTEILLVLPFGESEITLPHVRVLTATAELPRSENETPKPENIYLLPYMLQIESTYSLREHGPYSERNDTTGLTEYTQAGSRIGAQEPFDLIHCHDWISIPAGLEAKRISSKPLLLHIHSIEADRRGNSSNVAIRELERTGMREADHIIAVSNYCKKRIIDEYAVPEERITVIHNGVNRKSNLSQPAGNIRKGPPAILFLGRITWQKDPDCLIEAARLILDKMPNTHFTLAGKGDLLDEIRSKVREHGLEKQIKLPGFLSRKEVDATIAESDLLVMPSVSEPFGIAILEGAAAGLPVIVSETTGAREVLPRAVAFTAGNHRDLAGKILALLANPSLCREISASNLAALKECTWERTASKLKSVYHQLLHADAGPVEG